MKNTILVIFLMGLGVISTGCMRLGIGQTEKENISLENTKEISVQATSADIYIVAEDREDILVTLETFENGPKLKLKEGKNVSIEAKPSDWFNFGIPMNKSARLTVNIPIYYKGNLDVYNSSGDIEVYDLNLDEMVLDLTSGDIEANNLIIKNGTVTSVSGSISLSDLKCKTLSVTSTSGDLKLREFEGELSGSSGSGTVMIDYSKFNGNLNLEAASGDIIVDFNTSDIDANLDLSCTSGEITVPAWNGIIREKDSVVSGIIGDGTYDVILHTASGDIILK